jgi:hypothetical protein
MLDGTFRGLRSCVLLSEPFLKVAAHAGDPSAASGVVVTATTAEKEDQHDDHDDECSVAHVCSSLSDSLIVNPLAQRWDA